MDKYSKYFFATFRLMCAAVHYMIILSLCPPSAEQVTPTYTWKSIPCAFRAQ